MARLNQLHPNDYPSQEKIHDDIYQLVAFLQTTERGSKTLNDLLTILFDTAGALRSNLIEFQWASGQLQYRTGGGSWINTGATLATLQGPAGPSGAGTGDMVRATYDPDNDGMIDFAQLNIAAGAIPQSKVASLTSDLLARAFVSVSPTAPVSPTYPPTGPFHLWVDTSTSPQTIRWWDGVSQWRSFGGSSSSTVSVTAPQLIAGESVSDRDLVFLAQADDYGANVVTGGTALASAGTAGNLVDGNTATACDTASGTGWVGYQFAAPTAVGLLEVLFETGTRNHALVIETSPDGTTWTTIQTFVQGDYTGAHKTFFRIDTPVSASRIRLRATAGTSNLVVRELAGYTRSVDKGKVYRVQDTAANPAKLGDVLGIATASATTGSRVSVQLSATLLEGFTGLTAGSLYFTSGSAGGLSTTPSAKSVFVGEARSSTQLNFSPARSGREVGEIMVWAGTIANIPPGYRLCNGAILPRTQYNELFARIGSIFGTNDGQTSFYLPDLRDKFVVGAAQDNAGVPNTNLTGSLTQTGGSTAIVAGGGGASLAGATAPGQVIPPYYALAYIIRTH